MTRIGIATLAFIGALGAVAHGGAQSLENRQLSSTNTASTSSNAPTTSGPIQTLVVNTTSNPVPTVSVGVGAVRDADRFVSNRLTVDMINSGSGSRVFATDSFGQQTPLTAYPAEKVFVVTDLELYAYGGSAGDVAEVHLLHPTSTTVEYRDQLRLASFGNWSTGGAAEKVHFNSGLVFSDVPVLAFGGAQWAYAMLRGYLADASRHSWLFRPRDEPRDASPVYSFGGQQSLRVYRVRGRRRGRPIVREPFGGAF